MLTDPYLNPSVSPLGLSEIIPHIVIRKSVRKRFFDICFAFFALLGISPLFLFLALIVKLTSKGPVIYGHQRIGRGGKAFKCYKFRSMFQDAEVRLKDLLASDLALKEEWEKTFKLQVDPRVTPIGKVLRKLSLDELPQFWNVLIGDMSIVGPRPVMRKEIEELFRMKACKILAMRPGLTCLWQVSGRSEMSYAERIQLDELYVDSHSFWLDIKLIFKTIPAVIFSKGAC